jgi:glycosyltransferase involved in cell wall biosynthesis
VTSGGRPVRVLHVGKFYPPSRGGMERVVQVLCEAERASVDSQALVANDGPRTVRELVHGVPVTRVAALAKVGAVAVCPTFPWWMRKLASDVIVVHEPNPLALVAHALVRPSSRLLVWIHAEVVRPQWRYKAFYRPLLRRALSRADRIIVASPPMRDLAEELRDFRDKVVVIPYAIDPDQHALTPACCRLVEEIGGQHALPLALFVGRMVPYKGVDVLLRALKDVEARAILVGSGPLKATWEALAAELGLSGRVQFVGDVDQPTLTALYRACDVFVLPSVTRAEAFGMVQLEAMACSKPVISTLLPSGVPWVNRDGETGLVVPPLDVEALRLALQTLLSDPALRSAMGERGRARVLAEFSLERMVDQTTTLYRSLVEQPSRANDGVGTEAARVAAPRQW